MNKLINKLTISIPYNIYQNFGGVAVESKYPTNCLSNISQLTIGKSASNGNTKPERQNIITNELSFSLNI